MDGERGGCQGRGGGSQSNRKVRLTLKQRSPECCQGMTDAANASLTSRLCARACVCVCVCGEGGAGASLRGG